MVKIPCIFNIQEENLHMEKIYIRSAEVNRLKDTTDIELHVNLNENVFRNRR